PGYVLGRFPRSRVLVLSVADRDHEVRRSELANRPHERGFTEQHTQHVYPVAALPGSAEHQAGRTIHLQLRAACSRHYEVLSRQPVPFWRGFSLLALALSSAKERCRASRISWNGNPRNSFCGTDERNVICHP